MTVRTRRLPEGALLSKYARAGAYADCLTTDIPCAVSLAAYVEAFYTGRLFKLERFLLAWLLSKPSTDAQARELASGTASSFAGWQVEARSADQLLMCDFLGYTRSWLMVGPPTTGDAGSTRLYFGTGIVPARDRVSGQATWSLSFKALLPFHKIYARALLRGARSRLGRS